MDLILAASIAMLMLGVVSGFLYFLFRSIAKKNVKMLKNVVIVGAIVVVIGILFIGVLATKSLAEETKVEEAKTEEAAQKTKDPIAEGLKYLGASLAVGLSAIGAGIAVGPIGTTASSIVAEKPEFLGISFIYIGLAEGIAIYGIAIAILILFVF